MYSTHIYYYTIFSVEKCRDGLGSSKKIPTRLYSLQGRDTPLWYTSKIGSGQNLLSRPDSTNSLVLSRFFEDKKRLQHVVRFVFHWLDSMTCRTDVDVLFDVFVHVVSEIFFFNKSNVLSCSKWSAYESSWFYFKSFLLKYFERMYHLFFQRNKSFSIFHLNDESRSTFLRFLFDTTSSFLSKSKRFAFSFSFSCFIDAFSTKNRTRCANESNCCRINNTMRSFKYEALDVVFLFKTFFIQSFEARFSLYATFLSRSVLDIFSISRDNDLKDFFLFKILFTIATIFFSSRNFVRF
jgi:hypothetical protein